MLRTMGNSLSQPRVTLRLPADSSAPAQAREAVASLAHALPAPVPQKLSLAVSELVTNVLRHSGVDDPDPYLTLDITPSRVRLAVHDRGVGFDPQELYGEAGSGGGWGLKLGDSLVDRWRVEHVDGTRVVCEIDLPPTL